MSAPTLPANIPFRIDPGAIVVPQTAKVGDVIEITIPLEAWLPRSSLGKRRHWVA